MRVVVLGAGLLGVTSAYYLQQLGHEVIVVDRHATPAAKARGRADAGVPAAAVQHLQQSSARHAARARWLRLYMHLRRRFAKLIDRAIGEAPKSKPIEHLVRLGAYSRAIVRSLRDEAGVPPGQRNPGQLSLYTDADAFNARLARASHWHDLGCEERLVSAEEALQIEPALQALRGELAGAAYSLDDPATRDPAQFAASMVFLCRAAGVRFLTRHTVVSLEERGGRIDHVELRDADGQRVVLRGQAYVLALGISSAMHAEKLKIAMPFRFLREYIVTIPLKDASRAPRVALRDRQARLRIRRVETPAGDCLQASATVRASLDEENEHDSDRVDAILQRIETLLPGAADTAHASLETVVHAVSRNGLPMIGKTRLFNLFLNVAPGTRGWINACGAGKSIARIVSGLRPELEFAFRNP